MVEHERSYVFTHQGIKEFLEFKGLSLSEDYERIRDHYFSKGMRLRYKDGGTYVTRKLGDKQKGYRIEKELPIDSEAADLLLSETSLAIDKRRCKVEGVKTPDDKPYDITVDFIMKPMEIAILEIEAADPMSIPLPPDISHRLFGVHLRSCPCCTWEYFNRKIGFCGGPSCGKTEMAKWLSHQINTEFNGNAFHVTEYATSFIQKYERHPKFNDQMLLWYGQWRREHNARNADIVISDCPTFLTYIYAQILYDGDFCEQKALQLAKMYKQSLFDVGSYSDIWLMEISDYKDNRIRYHTKEEAIEIQERIRVFLDDHNILYRMASYQDGHRALEEILFLNTERNLVSEC